MSAKWKDLETNTILVPLVATVLAAVPVLAVILDIFNSQEGTLIVLALTLVVVIWYTYFTYQLAVRKEEPAVAAGIRYVPEDRDVRIIVENLTNRYLKARLWVQPQVYGQDANLGPDCSGHTIWHLTPQFTINGHFFLERPLQQVGKDFETMVAEANDENANRQLRLSLRIEWEDEDGHIGGYPEHFWYFNFRRNSFVYQVGGFKNT